MGGLTKDAIRRRRAYSRAWLEDCNASPLTLTAVKLAHRIADVSWRSGDFWESAATTAEALCVSRRSVIRARQLLLELELVKVIRLGTQRHPNHYQLERNFAADGRLLSGDTRGANTGANVVTSERFSGDSLVAQGCQAGSPAVSPLSPEPREPESTPSRDLIRVRHAALGVGVGR